ncbi:meiosis expressed gene 1 protein homolog isoform X2 [Chiroxiphia lanceolata]|uniref:meiosis expressed gene 1 protein homolog isoform X2 n=1 Tax=Chiroxiphia lanceolata TaxID=296741 RepID=UPI0013CED48F|nr:meiosis expressed gene 1 protein homolog isoform X2 [Chiroxiphia lanceolata]
MVTQEAADLSGCLEEARSLGESSISSQEVHSNSNMKKSEVPGVVAKADIKPKSMHRAKTWSDDVENLYRFQQAGYRDEVECWPETGFIKKLQRRDNTFFYYNKQRECEDKDVHKVKVYVY